MPVQPIPLRRPRNLLFAFLAAYFLLLSLQARRERSGPSRLQEWGLALLRPFALAASSAVDTARSAGTGIVDLHRAALENVRLRKELRQRDIELARLRGAATEVVRLRELLGYRTSAAPAGKLGRIVWADTRGAFKSLIVDVGSVDGAAADSAVLGSFGVVGRVVVAESKLSKIQLLIDENAAAGVLVERSRVQGVARGNGSGELIVEYLPRMSDVHPGDVILTSGTDGIYEPGVAVGIVTVSAEGDGMFRDVRVRPAVRFDALEAVLVLPPRGIPVGLTSFHPSQVADPSAKSDGK